LYWYSIAGTWSKDNPSGTGSAKARRPNGIGIARMQRHCVCQLLCGRPAVQQDAALRCGMGVQAQSAVLQGDATNNAIATISVAIDYIKRTESATAVFATAICNCYSRMRDGRV
jgi:hypothetical protein